MMKNKLIILGSAVCLLMASFFCSCEDDDVKAKAVPVINFQVGDDALFVNLNELRHPMIVCVVNSETGLRSVDMFIVKEDENGNEIEERYSTPINKFYNPEICSIHETPFYTDEMKKFKVVATDRAGQVTVGYLQFDILPLFGLPEIYFSRDEAGTDRIQPPYRYVEEATMENIYAQISSEEDLKYVVFYQSIGNQTTRINDTVFFDPGVKQAAVNVSYWDNGEEYVFAKGTTALRARATAGELKKMREASLTIDYKYLVDLTLDQSADYFNGLPLNGTATLSGTITAENGLQSCTYTLINRCGGTIQANAPISVNPDGTFTATFTAVNDLGSIVLKALDDQGKTNEQTYDVHVGYKYYYLLAGHAGRGTNSKDADPGPFVSAPLGKTYSYCSAKNQTKYIDGGFELWNSDVDLRLNSITLAATKLNSTNITCKTSTWSYQKDVVFGLSTIAYANFDQTTINTMKAQTIVKYPNLNGEALMTGMTTANPTPTKIVIYDTMVDDIPKRVIIAVDKMQDYVGSGTTTIQDITFWIKMKVEL